MAKETGLGDRLYVHGYDLSGDIGAVQTVKAGVALLDVTDLTKSAFERINGQRDGEISFRGFFNPAATQQHPALSAFPTTDRLVAYAHGTTLGNPAACMSAKQVDYQVERGDDGSLKTAVQCLSTGTPLDWGVQYTAGKVTHASATNETSIDFGAASTAFGATAYFFLFSLGSGTITARFEDSADNVSFLPITGLTFANQTAGPAAERLTTAAGATVRRYVRFASTNTFTTAVLFAAFTRHLTTPVLS